MAAVGRDEFVEQAGVHFQRMGLSRTAGRSLGYLLVSADGTADAGELCEALGVAKSSVSVALRQLEDAALVERFRPPRGRRDRYRVCEDVFGRAFRIKMGELDGVRRLIDHGLDVVGDNTEARERLELMSRMYAFMGREFPKLLDRWDEERAGTD